MELIFYPEAAALLGVKINTINQAIERGILTRAGRQGRKMCLVREQVMLFTGVNHRTGNKKRLSLEALTPEEKRLWQQYDRLGANQANTENPPRQDIRAIVHQELNQELAPLFKEMATLNTEEDATKQRLAAIQGQKEGFRKALSILKARAAELATA